MDGVKCFSNNFKQKNYAQESIRRCQDTISPTYWHWPTKPQLCLRVQLFFATMICCTLHTSPSTDRPAAPNHPPPSQGCQPTSPVAHHHRLTFRSSFQPTSGWKFLQDTFEENIFSTKLLHEVFERERSSKLNCLKRRTFYLWTDKINPYQLISSRLAWFSIQWLFFCKHLLAVNKEKYRFIHSFIHSSKYTPKFQQTQTLRTSSKVRCCL